MMKNEHWMLRFKMTENSGVSRCYLTRIWLVAEKKNRKKTETTDCNMAFVPHVSYFVLLIIYNMYSNQLPSGFICQSIQSEKN